MTALTLGARWRLDALENDGHTLDEVLRFASVAMDAEDAQQQMGDTANVRVISPDDGPRRWRWRRWGRR